MKIKLSDFVADFLVENKITKGFTVVGGGAMHLNDSFGHKNGLDILYCHHEQACSIAAESYSRLNNMPALVNVTTGPGGVNALNGVASAYLDSLPMFVVSGQVRYDTTIAYAKKNDNANLRSLGDQEFNIVDTVKTMTKYSVMIEDPNTIKYHLERALYLATHGRKGPVWIDIPVDFQAAIIETDDLKSYIGSKEHKDDLAQNEVCDFDDKKIDEVIDILKNAKRPIIYAGYGIRLSGGYEVFKKVIEKLNIPVVTYWNAIDLMETENKLYVGRGGNMGDRAGNFAVENADVILAIGTRLSIRQVGYNYKEWAKNAKVIMVDIDKEEFKKHTIHVDIAIHSDAKLFLEALDRACESAAVGAAANSVGADTIRPNCRGEHCEPDWLATCNNWKEKYKVVGPDKYNKKKDFVNVYAFIDCLSKSLPDGSLTAVSNGACCVVGSQSFYIKKGTRLHNNSATASMGYGLPASIGSCISNDKKETYCLEGDGSIMMNLQELQTIVTNKLTIKIFLINNEGYHSIRITQNNLFKEHTKVGIGVESNDLSFPKFEKIANAFGLKYMSAHNDDEMKKVVDSAIKESGAVFVEIFTDKEQVWEPKSSAKKLPDGTLVSPPLYDMEPFMPEDELKSNLFN
ncbi:MAG: thiamine pyrophosphate-binding protein [Lachnospiraceae bacterium]|nr:thiamine pyrophosphate-binding protein [Lachnospiraceae bacterium]